MTFLTILSTVLSWLLRNFCLSFVKLQEGLTKLFKFFNYRLYLNFDSQKVIYYWHMEKKRKPLKNTPDAFPGLWRSFCSSFHIFHEGWEKGNWCFDGLS